VLLWNLQVHYHPSNKAINRMKSIHKEKPNERQRNKAMKGERVKKKRK
jgi:hypothetical protein